MPGTAQPGGTWSSLGHELIQEVTHHVVSEDRAALRQTSRHWQSAVSATVSCAKLDLSSSSGYWDNVQQRLLLAFPQVTELLLCGGAQAKDAGTKITQLRRWAAFLTALTVTGGTPLDVWLPPRCWQALLQPQRPPGTPPALAPALCQLTGLRRLSMDCCLGFPAPHALAGLSSLKELSHLELHSSREPAVTWCALVGGACYAALADTHLAALSSSCPGLVSLRLTHLTDASEEGLGLLGGCQGLTQLELCGPWRSGLCLQQAAQALTAQLSAAQQQQQQQQQQQGRRRVSVKDQQLVLVGTAAAPGPDSAMAPAAAAAACTQPSLVPQQPERRGSIDSCSSMYSAEMLPGSHRSSMESSCSRRAGCEGPSRTSLDSIIGGLTALGARSSMDSSTSSRPAAAGGATRRSADGGVVAEPPGRLGARGSMESSSSQLAAAAAGAAGGGARPSMESSGAGSNPFSRLGARGSLESSSSQLAAAAAGPGALAGAPRPSMDCSGPLSRLGGRGSMDSNSGLPPRADVAGATGSMPAGAGGASVPCSALAPWVGRSGTGNNNSSIGPGSSSAYNLTTRSSVSHTMPAAPGQAAACGLGGRGDGRAAVAPAASPGAAAAIAASAAGDAAAGCCPMDGSGDDMQTAANKEAAEQQRQPYLPR